MMAVSDAGAAGGLISSFSSYCFFSVFFNYSAFFEVGIDNIKKPICFIKHKGGQILEWYRPLLSGCRLVRFTAEIACAKLFLHESCCPPTFLSWSIQAPRIFLMYVAGLLLM